MIAASRGWCDSLGVFVSYSDDISGHGLTTFWLRRTLSGVLKAQAHPGHVVGKRCGKLVAGMTMETGTPIQVAYFGAKNVKVCAGCYEPQACSLVMLGAPDHCLVIGIAWNFGVACWGLFLLLW